MGLFTTTITKARVARLEFSLCLEGSVEHDNFADFKGGGFELFTHFGGRSVGSFKNNGGGCGGATLYVVKKETRQFGRGPSITHLG